MADNHSGDWKVAWKSGSGTRWSIGLRRASEEITIRATNSEQADIAAQAVIANDATRYALQRAHNAMYVHGDCADCMKALETVEAVLGARDELAA